MKTFKQQSKHLRIVTLVALLATTLPFLGSLSACSSLKSALAINEQKEELPPISNPFGEYYAGAPGSKADSMIFRTKKGDRTVEFEIPSQDGQMTDFTVPISPAFNDARGRYPAGMSAEGVDDQYLTSRPTLSDREILNSQLKGSSEDAARKAEIERGLGLAPNEDDAEQDRDPSYLAAIDHVKQLYRRARYEAALIEVDRLLVSYQTDPKLYEMRGTLFDRLGRPDLANRSWQQALRFDPNNRKLKRFLDRRMPASVAPPAATPEGVTP